MAKQRRKSVYDLDDQADRLIRQTNDKARMKKISEIFLRYFKNISKTERWRKVNASKNVYTGDGSYDKDLDKHIANQKKFSRSTYMGLSKG